MLRSALTLLKTSIRTTATSPTSGLLGIPELTSPQGFQTLWNKSRLKCERLLSEIEQSKEYNYKIIASFDHISNIICLVADSANFISENHSKEEIRSAARDIFSDVSNYVEELNTNKNLYEAIKGLVNDPAVFSSLSPAQQHAAVMFIFDFEQSGIHLPAQQKNSYVKLNDAVLQLGYHFIDLTTQPVLIPASKCPTELLGLPRHKGSVILTNSEVDNPYDDIREAAWKRFHKNDKNREDVLRNLLNHRHSIATHGGFDNFAKRELHGTMAKSYQNVHDFLSELHHQLSPLVETELSILSQAKSKHSRKKNETINVWDAPYYTTEQRSKFIAEHNYPLGMYSNTLNIKALVSGLTKLLEDVFGIWLVEEVPEAGELWSEDIIKLTLLDEQQGVMGIIYGDFLRRKGKDSKTCMYTIQCGTLEQIPITALQCNFGEKENLSHDQIENFFHEFGHAIHATLGRTEFQHVSGTRGPTDLAEIPSIFFEQFVNHPDVFASILPQSNSTPHTPNLMPLNSVYNAITTQTQLLYSMVDLELHSQPLTRPTTEVVAELQQQYSSLKYPQGSSWHQRFGHLHTYGSRYYSYLWARSISNIIHQELFSTNGMSREGGEAVKSFLKYGGSVDPQWLVQELIGSDLTVDRMVSSLVGPIRSFSDKYLE